MTLRVLELFCGIGGMSCALTEACGGEDFEVVAAVDINHVALDIYTHNFTQRPVWNRNIQGMTADTIDKLKVDMITMSPPCQPFTRLGKQGDVQDNRASAFLHLLNVFPKINNKPKYLVMENVSGFDKSQAREMFITVLKDCGYTLQEFLLSPTQFSVPNSRLRYYLIAKQGPMNFKTTEHIMNAYPTCSECGKCKSETFTQDNTLSPLSEYLDKSKEGLDSYLVPVSVLKRWGRLLDVVDSNSSSCCCFTKGYSRHVEGTGSIIDNHCYVEQTNSTLDKLTKTDETSVEFESLASQLSLRYFTEHEVARLHHFPSGYGFPDSVTLRQRYKSLGNSLNVHVVGQLMKLLLSDVEQCCCDN